MRSTASQRVRRRAEDREKECRKREQDRSSGIFGTPNFESAQALHVTRLRIILSRVRCLVASPVQAILTRSKSEFFTPYSGLSQPRRELPLATIEAGCIIPEGGIMTCVLHHLDLRMSYGSFVLVNH